MADTVTLLPGTLSAELQGNILLVHVLNASGPYMQTLSTLERRIGDLFRHNSKPSTQ
jgi:multicomponent Na+:H+ antiporter subunit E